MKCKNCGCENDKKSKYCQACGNKLKKKKLWLIPVIIFAFILIIFIVAVSSDSDTDTEDTNTDTKVTNEVSSEESTEAKSNIEFYNVELKSSRIATDTEGKKILIVNWIFTNNSDEARCFDFAVEDKAYQDGIELGTVWSSYGITDLDFDLAQKEIKPGKSLEVQSAYELNDNKTTVEIEFQLFSAWTDKIYKTFEVKLK